MKVLKNNAIKLSKTDNMAIVIKRLKISDSPMSCMAKYHFWSYIWFLCVHGGGLAYKQQHLPLILLRRTIIANLGMKVEEVGDKYVDD